MKLNLFLLSLISLTLLSCKSSDDQIKNWVEKNPDKILQALMKHQQQQQEKINHQVKMLKRTRPYFLKILVAQALVKGQLKLLIFLISTVVTA